MTERSRFLTVVDYRAMRQADLYAMAREWNLPGRSTKSHTELAYLVYNEAQRRRQVGA